MVGAFQSGGKWRNVCSIEDVAQGSAINADLNTKAFVILWWVVFVYCFVWFGALFCFDVVCLFGFVAPMA